MSETRLVPVGPGPIEPDPGPIGPSGSGESEQTPRTDGPERDAASASVSEIEALLFVAERPLTRAELRTLTGLARDEVDARLGDLEMQLRDRGIRLVSSGEQVMLGTSPESGRLIARYLGADEVRLSPAALETLAIVAYRQPVTRGTIERIRGVDSGHVVRGLLHRRLILEQGRADSPGRPILYVTSMEFMERFGLTSLDDLPPIEAEVAGRLVEAAAAEAPDEEGAEPDDLGEAGEAQEPLPFDDG
jgi:segregation and condensation protein B